MLVLGRREGDQIRVGRDVVITIVKLRGKICRIGVEAPKETLISRVEPAKKGEGENDG